MVNELFTPSRNNGQDRSFVTGRSAQERLASLAEHTATRARSSGLTPDGGRAGEGDHASEDTYERGDGRPDDSSSAGTEFHRDTSAPLASGRLVQRWWPGENASGFSRVVSRVDPGRRGWLALACAAAVGAVLVAVYLWLNHPVEERVPELAPAAANAPPAKGAPPVPQPETKRRPPPLVVSVVGRVAHPGLVHVTAGARVADALEAAGDPLPGTDVTTLNLARKVADGEQLYVGVPVPPQAATAGSGAAPSGAGRGESGKLDLNAATDQQLDELDGVGEVMAQRIVRWRTENGRFTSVEQLREVDGVGETRFERLKDQVRV